jgi:hypothetical protein
MPKPKRAIQPTAQALELPSEIPTATLREEVKQALRAVLRDPSASAAAKASAGRTLLEYFDDSESSHASARRGADMSAAELDHAIALFEKQ